MARRYFDEAEDESKRPVVIVNRTMAREYFAGEDLYTLILGEAAWLAGTGTALGLASAAAVFAISALLASYIPARRAASVNPIDALRAE